MMSTNPPTSRDRKIFVTGRITQRVVDIVASSYYFAQLDAAQTSASDRTTFVRMAHKDSSRQYVRNNATRIMQILRAVDRWLSLRVMGDVARENPIQVLEVGLGYGEVARCVADYWPDWHLMGLEHPDRSYLKLAEYRSMLRESSINIVAANISDRNLAIATDSCDICLFCEVLEHLPPTLVPAFISELSRVTRPGGGVIIATPNLTSLFNRLAFILGKSVFGPAVSLDYARGTYGHIRLYNPQEVTHLANRAGLELVETWYCNANLFSGGESVPVLIVKRLQSILTRLYPPLANGWTALYRKVKC